MVYKKSSLAELVLSKRKNLIWTSHLLEQVKHNKNIYVISNSLRQIISSVQYFLES